MRESPSKTKRSVLEAGLLAASLVSSFDHMAEAAEIQPAASWEQGISEMQRSVREDPVERATIFLYYKDHSGRWIPQGRGDATSISPGNKTFGETIADESGNAPIGDICMMHTHPSLAIRHVFAIDQADNAYAPPSSMDALIMMKGAPIGTISEKLGEKNQSFESVTGAVVDPRGIWYFRPLTEAEKLNYPKDDKNFMDKSRDFEKVQRRFVGASVLSAQFDFNVEYEKLRQTYRALLSTEVRFVPNQDIQNEPPCAGTDYKPH